LTRRIAGIDYGSKLAGTTVIAYTKEESIYLLSSKKKQDADQMIINWAENYQPEQIFIDAPISLPGVYTDPKNYNDYFYRQADRALSAMSPMFLGGLTARAMRLCTLLKPIPVCETYPGGLAKLFKLDRTRYKKDKHYLPTALSLINQHLHLYKVADEISNWHQFDALLALTSSLRYLDTHHISYGNAEEGQIFL
jgi:predicted nuclease with RNAse H fold